MQLVQIHVKFLNKKTNYYHFLHFFIFFLQFFPPGFGREIYADTDQGEKCTWIRIQSPGCNLHLS